MADLAITPDNVAAGPHATKHLGTAGATLAAGKAIYVDPADKKVKLSDANGAAAAKTVDGITLNGAANGQPIEYDSQDAELNLGATLVPGTIYVLSDTPGGIAPATDGVTGDTTVVIGEATSTSLLNLAISAGGVKP
jgi:hypothetical protein